MTIRYIPASLTNPGFDAAGDPLSNPSVVGHNGAEAKIDFSPVENSWPNIYSIPGADIPSYEFNGDPGDIELGIDQERREASFVIRKTS